MGSTKRKTRLPPCGARRACSYPCQFSKAWQGRSMSELNTQPQLYVSGANIRSTGYSAEVRVVKVGVGTAELGRVGEIKHLGPELSLEVFEESEVLQDGQVGVVGRAEADVG